MKHTVTRAIEATNANQPSEPQSTDPDAPLLDGPWDSLGIVEFLVALENELPGANLLGNPDVIDEGGPLETVGSLIEYLEAQRG